MVDGIILAGGKSTRARENKMLLVYKDKPLIYHSLRTMNHICENVTIVTGHYDIDYKTHFPEMTGIQVIHNSDYKLGMFSSVKKGVMQLKNDFFLIPGDYPLVKVETYTKLLQAEGQIRVPTYKGYKGHPIFIKKELIPDLKKEDINSNLKVFRNRYEVTYIEVDDEGILFDIDSTEDYKRLIHNERNEPNGN